MEKVLAHKKQYTNEVQTLLIGDIREIANESIGVGDYEGPQYVQSIYEDEQRERQST